MGAREIIAERLIIIPMNYSIVCSVLENRDEELDMLGVCLIKTFTAQPLAASQ